MARLDHEIHAALTEESSQPYTEWEAKVAAAIEAYGRRCGLAIFLECEKAEGFQLGQNDWTLDRSPMDIAHDELYGADE